MNFSALNNFDYLILAIVLLSVLFGFLKGFIRSSLSLLTWFGAGFIAYITYPVVKPFFTSHFSNEIIGNVAGPVAVYFVALTIISLLNYQLITLLGGICGGIIDRSLGLLFGFARGALICSILFAGLTMVAPGLSADKTAESYQDQVTETDQAAPDWLKNAQTYGLLKTGSNSVMASIPEEWANKTQQLIGANKKSDAQQTSLLDATTIVQQMQAVLPKNLHLDTIDMSSLDKMPKDVADSRRKEIYRLILESYKNSLKSGKIAVDKIITADDIKKLENALSSSQQGLLPVQGKKLQEAATPSAGYDKKQINELERLIQTVQ